MDRQDCIELADGAECKLSEPGSGCRGVDGDCGAQFGHRKKVGVFLAHVEKVGLVRSERPVTHAIGNDNRPDVVSGGVDNAGADAAAGGAAGDQQRVDPPESQPGGEVRAEEGARMLFAEHGLARIGASSGTICDSGLVSVSFNKAGTFIAKAPASDPSSA
jgi:hypothetical protein